MSDFSQLDLNVRLRLSGQKYSEMVSEYVDSLRWGMKSSLIKETKLTLLGVYIEMLLDYNIATCGETISDNCITYEEAELVCENISKITGICFQPAGFNYQGAEKQGGIGKMQIGCSFVVS